MNRILTACLLSAFFCLTQQMSALEWDNETYSRIQDELQEPAFPNLTISVTQTGASTSASPEHNRNAIQKAIDKCWKKGGGTVLFPKNSGCFQSGAIQLKSHVNLQIEEGDTLQFVFKPELYPIVETAWEGLDCFNISPCIYAFNATDIAITGKGTVDGAADELTWWKWCGSKRYGWKEGMPSQKDRGRPRLMKVAEEGEPLWLDNGKRNPKRVFSADDCLRPQLIGFNQCRRVIVQDVRLIRSPFWTLHPLKCSDLTVRGVDFDNNGPNGDGCNPESCDRVIIENCNFNTGDDCIAIKSGRNADGRNRNMPSQNIIIRHCTMKNGHGGVVIGSEISGGCNNVFAHDCKMDSPNLERVLRIKTNTCRGGVIQRIFMRKVQVGQCRESVLKINLNYEPNELCCRGFMPLVKDVCMDSVWCGKSKYGLQVIALESDTLVKNIYLSNCWLNGLKEGYFSQGNTENVRLKNVFFNGELYVPQIHFKHYSEWMTFSEMMRMEKPFLLDFADRPKWSYAAAVELEAMLDTYLEYKNHEILDYCQIFADSMITADGDLRGYRFQDFNLDNLRPGHFIARLNKLIPEEKNNIALTTLFRQTLNQPRTEIDSIFWHKTIYAYQVWLDGIFMALPFYALYAKDHLGQLDANRVFEDCAKQIIYTYQRTLDQNTMLNRHAWDETKLMFWADKSTGLSKHAWGRAQGWFSMALLEIIELMPENCQYRQQLVTILNNVLTAVANFQDKQTGLWFQVLDQPGIQGNYLEASCSAMFTYVMLKAARLKLVTEKFKTTGIKAYKGIIKEFIAVNPDNTISLRQCCAVAGLGPGVSDRVREAAPDVRENRRRNGEFQYYISEPIRENDPKGVGPFIWASIEMERLGFQL